MRSRKSSLIQLISASLRKKGITKDDPDYKEKLTLEIGLRLAMYGQDPLKGLKEWFNNDPLGKEVYKSIFGDPNSKISCGTIDVFGLEGLINFEAKNVLNGIRLSKQLTLEEALSAFTKEGMLKPEVIKNSRAIIAGSRLEDTNVIKNLTKDGSSISDWTKMTTETIKSPSGDFQVHFYQNIKTGEVSTYGMESKFTKVR